MKPIFNKRIFWDVDFEKIDYEKNAVFVVSRVIERGDVEDIRQCRRCYGDEKIADILLNIDYLPENKIYLAAALINHSITEFKCYKKRQLNQGLFPY